METENKKINVIKVRGEIDLSWENLRPKFIEIINNFLDSTIHFERGTSIRDEGKKLISLTLDFAEDKLKRPGIENAKMLAEVDEVYSKIELNKAEARKINAEANSLELETSLKKLKVSLRLAKVLMIGKEGQEAIVVTKQIDSFLDAIEAFTSENNQLMS